MSNLTWFLHKPTDEREQALYQRAYQTAFYTASICLILVLVAVWVFPGSQPTATDLAFMVLATLLVSYVSGWVVLRKEDLALNSTASNTAVRKQIRIYWMMLLIYSVGSLVSILLHPELYLRFVLGYGSLVYFCSFGTALAAGKVFPLPVRIVLAIFLPVPTIIWLSVSRGSAAKKLAVVIALCVALIISMGVMIIAVRQFIVSPFYIGTDAFAPTYTKGQYVLVSDRQGDPTSGQYIMYFVSGDTPKVGQVLSVPTAGQYQVRTADGEATIDQNHLLGKILPGDSWLDWLHAE